MVTPTDDPQVAATPSARSKVPDPRADMPKTHGDTGRPSATAKKWSLSPTQLPSIIVGVVILALAGLSIWYLVRPQPLLVQGEVDATRYDIAARVDGRVGEVPVERGQNVAAGAVLVRIDNPETIAKNDQALAARIVAESQLANVNVGTRPEVIAERKAELTPAASARDLYLLAGAHARKGGRDGYTQALAELNRALELNPRHYWAWIQRGLCHQELKEYVLAAGDFGTCVGLWPEFAWGYFSRAWLLDHTGKKAEAVAEALSGVSQDKLPAAGARGQDRTLFLVDEAAAADLPKAG